MEKLYNKALKIAIEAHKSQVDKSGQTYILHPIRVAQRCKTIEEKIVALLHDTIEDTYVTPEYLLNEGFPQHIIEAILSVTKQKEETYFEFIFRASKNPIGKVVKICDLEDNMDITRLNTLTEKDFERLTKYLKSYKFLTTGNISHLKD